MRHVHFCKTRWIIYIADNHETFIKHYLGSYMKILNPKANNFCVREFINHPLLSNKNRYFMELYVLSDRKINLSSLITTHFQKTQNCLSFLLLIRIGCVNTMIVPSHMEGCLCHFEADTPFHIQIITAKRSAERRYITLCNIAQKMRPFFTFTMSTKCSIITHTQFWDAGIYYELCQCIVRWQVIGPTGGHWSAVIQLSQWGLQIGLLVLPEVNWKKFAWPKY